MTETEKGMLTAIATDQSHDMLKWEVYADSLEEAGKSELAEYVRLAAEMERCGCGDTICDTCQAYHKRMVVMAAEPDLADAICDVADYISNIGGPGPDSLLYTDNP